MRKISELLDISKPFHISFGGHHNSMCIAAIEAMEQGEITIDEYYELEFHNMKLVEEIDRDALYLFEALGFDHTHESDKRQIKDWWEDHINTLKEKGL